MVQYICLIAGVAQSVEQLIRNQQVGGSSPPTSSIKKEGGFAFFFYTELRTRTAEGVRKFAVQT